MEIQFNENSIKITNEADFNLHSSDNRSTFATIYFQDDGYIPSSKHAIRVFKNGYEITNALVCETCGATSIHEHSFLVSGDSLLICCSNTVYSFELPNLKLNWKKRLDQITCFGIYNFKNGFVVHGEMEITKIDSNGSVEWTFGGKDIFVTEDGDDGIKVSYDRIDLTDWDGDKYTLDENGKMLSGPS